MDIRSLLSLPSILDVKKIVCVQPHPDDNEVGAAGTLAELAARKSEIVFITVTDGGAGGSSGITNAAEIVEMRRQERLEAGRMVGVSKHIAFDFPDGGDYTEREVMERLVPIFREERPDMLMTVDPWMPYEAHPDHVKTGKAVSSAMLFAGNNVLFPGTEPFAVPQIAMYATAHPNTYVDITQHWQRKLDAIRAHKSQFDNAGWPMIQAYLQYESTQMYGKWKQDAGVSGYAEAFKVLASQQLHFFPAALYS